MLQVPAPKQLRPSRHVTVYGLPLETPEQRIREFFSKFGKVKRVRRLNQNVFITFKTSKIAATAFSAPDMWLESNPYRMAYYHAPPTAPEATSPENQTSDSSSPNDDDDLSPGPIHFDEADEEHPEHHERRRNEDRREQEEEKEEEYDGRDDDRDREADSDGDDHGHDHEDNNDDEDDGVSEDDGEEDGGGDDEGGGEEDGDEDASNSPSCSSKYQEPSKPEHSVLVKRRAPRDFWADRSFPPGCVVCIVYKVSVESVTERQLFDLIKVHIKRFGDAKSILGESTSDPSWKKFIVNCSSLAVPEFIGSRLEDREKNSIEYRLSFKPLSHRMPEDTIRITSESNAQCENFRINTDRLLGVGLSIRIPNPNRYPRDLFQGQFNIYGTIINLESVSDGSLPVINIEFSTVAEAYAASRDTRYPNITIHSSKPAQNLIMFYLPKLVKEDELMIKLRGLSDDIDMVTVDFSNSRALFHFKSVQEAEPALKKLKENSINFGADHQNHKIAVDYCSPQLTEEFMRRKDYSEHQRLEAIKSEKEALKKAQEEKEAAKEAKKAAKSAENAGKNVVKKVVKEKKDTRNKNDTIAQSGQQRYQQQEKFVYHKAKCKQCVDDHAAISVPSTSGIGAQTARKYENGHRHVDNEENINNGHAQPHLSNRRPQQNHQERRDSLNESKLTTRDDEDDVATQPSTSSPLPTKSHPPPSAATVPPTTIQPNGSSNHQRRHSSSTDQSLLKDPPERHLERVPSVISPQTIERTRGSSTTSQASNAAQRNKPKRPVFETEQERINFHKRLESVSARHVAALTQAKEILKDRPKRYTTVDETMERTIDSKKRIAEENEAHFNLPPDEKPNLCRSFAASDMRTRINTWQRVRDNHVLEDYRADCTSLLRFPGPHSLAPISIEDARETVQKLREKHRLEKEKAASELAQRSQSVSIGPSTPLPFHTAATPSPLLVNTSHSTQHTPGSSGHQPAVIMTPRGSQNPLQPSPVSRHSSISSTGRPANIQSLRQSVVFPPDTSIPPPPIPPQIASEINPMQTAAQTPTPVRRSSESMTPLRSPQFSAKHIPPLMSTPTVPPPPMPPSGTHSVSSSTTSTPRHSISGTPGPPPSAQHQDISKRPHPEPPKPVRPEKIQVRHDSISKPGPSSAASALQARSQSMSVGDPKRSVPTTPVVRDAGSDLIEQIISAEHGKVPSMGFKKLPRIEKKSSALSNVPGSTAGPSAPASAQPSTPVSSAPVIAHKDKEREKEKEKRRKEREREEKERQARKEMKKNETKEERHKRKEMERMKREEEERKERKREKQRQKEKEERKKEREKEKEKERRKAEKEKLKKKKQRRDEASEPSGSSESEEITLDSRKGNKEMTQEEKDHQLAVLLSRGGIIENIRSRKRPSEKHSSDSLEKLRQKTQAANPRRVLIESSDEDDEEDEDEKQKSDSSSDSEAERRELPPPPKAQATPAETPKEHKQKVHKEREKGELSSSSEEEEEEEEEATVKQKVKLSKVEPEGRKRQKSSANYSSDDHNERVEKKKKKRSIESEERKKMSDAKEEQRHRKRKLDQRRSTEEESRRRAKRDFPVQLEDVSDEEEAEVEDHKRIRRPSTSSTASTKEKSGKTPLRVTTPAVTPLQSPNILSPKVRTTPKLLSPKTSSSSMKRPSISEQEPLVSPKARGRTTSSTSTATSVSRHESVTHTDKPRSPPVTAKSSISSIDDFVIREDISQTSAAASPMSASGRPMVLTKAAMKAFHTSPPKRTRGHDDSSSTEDSSASSSNDSSDDEAGTSSATIGGAEGSGVSASQDLPPPPIPPTLPAPVLSVHHQEPALPVLSSAHNMPPPPAPPVIPSKLSHVEMQRWPAPVAPAVASQEDEREEGEYIEDAESEEVHQIGEDAVQREHRDPSPQDTLDESNASSGYAGYASPEYDPPPTHTLISDQETEEAVQSIFDEEADDDFPQYPDFVMPRQNKESSEKDPFSLPGQERLSSLSVPSTSHMLTDDDDDQIVIPQPPENPMIEFNEKRRLEYLKSLELQQQQFGDTEMVVTERVVPMDEMIEQEIVNEEPLLSAPPEQTPTPELIPNNEESENVPPREYRIAAPIAIRPFSSEGLEIIYRILRPPDISVEEYTALPREYHQKRSFLELVARFIKNSSWVQEQLRQNPTTYTIMVEYYDQITRLPRQHCVRSIPSEISTFYIPLYQMFEDDRQRKEREDVEKAIKKSEDEVKLLQEQQKKAGEQQDTIVETAALPPGLDSLPLGVEQLCDHNQPEHAIRSESPRQLELSDNWPEKGTPQYELAHQKLMYRCFPLLWCGDLLLKNSKTAINLHMVNGSKHFLDTVLGQNNRDGTARRDSIRITQRLRIDNGQIEHIHGILTNPDYGCAIALSSATEKEAMLAETAILQTQFEEYFLSKQVAGISSLEPELVLQKARVHVFGPCELVHKYLSELAPKLYNHLMDINAHFLFFVFTNDETIPNMTIPPGKESLYRSVK